MAFKNGVILGPVSLNATGTSNTAIGATSNSGTISIGNTTSGAVAIDCGTAGIIVGTTANAHNSTFGSTDTTSGTTIACGTGGAAFATSANVHSTFLGGTFGASDTTLQSGSGALNVTATGGALTINSGVGALSISNDASATTVNLATGGAAKTVTLGSVTTTSSLSLKYGTSDFTLASATGTVMSALDTGEITYPLQPAFYAINSATDANVTGNGTDYTVICDTEIYDQNSDYNNGTGVFTAPVTGRYHFQFICYLQQTTSTTNYVYALASNRTQDLQDNGIGSPDVSGNFIMNSGIYMDMDAADTIVFHVLCAGTTLTVDVAGSVATAPTTSLAGMLVC